MGYYVVGEGTMRIRKENLDAAHAALMALQDAPSEAKRGGSYSAEGRRHWFSWMPEDLTTLKTTQEFFEQVGFSCEVDEKTGDLIISDYDNKTGQEEVFVAAAAPFIEDGDYEWTGEDGDFWKWQFREGKMFLLSGRRIYDHAAPVGVESLLGNYKAQHDRVEAMFSKK